MVAASDTVYIVLASLFGGVVTLAVGGGATLLFARFRRRRENNQTVVSDTQRLKDTVYGRKPSFFEKHPPQGLEERLALVEAILTDQREMLASLLAKTTPNGGTTREIGDIILLIAEKLDIDVPEREHGEHH